MNGDCYSILGVPAAATTEEIRAAYRRLARQYHPDLNAGPEAEARMKEINQAYATLSDPQRRRHYDVYGVSEPPAAAPRRPSQHNGARPGTTRPSRPRAYSPSPPQRGEDIETALLITRREARQGMRKVFPVTRTETCQRCRGTGFEPEETLEASQCWRCAGEQRVRRELWLSATIPAGVTDGRRLRLRGQGNAGLDGGASGHIYITVRVAQRARLRQAVSFVLRHLFR
jgi:DnaJ-class molecular chaperone